MRLNSAKDMEVYKKAYALAMRVFELSKRFPSEERYALTGQIRRSSRSVCLNLREAKRRYEAHFISKLTDCDGENSETDSSLSFFQSVSSAKDGRKMPHTNKTSITRFFIWNPRVGDR